jgi:transcriptional regulator with XRE-family HTH domain
MKHPVDAHVGKRIRHRRWMVGMTQQQLADKVGIKFQQIQKYETGMNRVSASRLWDIADAWACRSRSSSKAWPKVSSRRRRQGDMMADKEALELVRSYYAIPRRSAAACSIWPACCPTRPDRGRASLTLRL